MQIRFLGPVEVLKDGQPVPLGGAKQKALLVLLAWQPEIVATERLVDLLWAGHPPRSAVNVVQTYVYRLRNLLGADVIRARRPGYQFILPGDALDVTRAQQQRRAGQRALDAQDAGSAARHFRAALTAFRGRPLADLRSEPAVEELAASLDRLRLDLHEAALAAELDTGAGAELIPELTALAQDHPLRETLHGHLMVALARAGRQSEALEVYRALRDTLAESIGADPSPPLQQLELRVLRQDPALLLPTRTTIRQTIPAPLTPLQGREKAVTEVLEMLGGHARLITLVGPGGVGKTRLALEAARQQGALAWVDLTAVSHEADIMPAIARTLGASLPEPASALDTVADMLADRATPTVPGALIVIDNLEHLPGAGPLLTDLLARVPGLRVLATSRHPLNTYGEWRLPVPPLDLADAQLLLTTRARAAAPNWRPDPADEGEMRAVCQQLEGLPLALELVAVHLPETTASALAASLAGGLPGGTALGEALDWSLRLLPAEDAAAFCRLAVFAGSFDAEAAARITGRADATQLLRRLVNCSLLQRDAARVRMLRVLQGFARRRMPPEHWRQARDRHAEYVLTLAEEAAGPQSWTWPDAERAGRLDDHADEIDRALIWLRKRGQGGDLLLASHLWPYWHLRGRIAYADRWLRPAIGQQERDVPPAVRGRCLLGLAWVCLSRQDMDTAIRAAELAERLLSEGSGSPSEVAAAKTCLASLLAPRCDVALSREKFTTAADIARAHSDSVSLHHTLLNWGNSEHFWGELDRAKALWREAQDHATEPQASHSRPALFSHFGLVDLRAGNLSSAVRHFCAAADSAATRHASVELAVLSGLAAVAARTARLDLAQTMLGAIDAVVRSTDERPQADIMELVREVSVDVNAGLPALQAAVARARGLTLTVDDAVALARDM